ncbi:MAG: DUF4915 domain-containing protein [Mesorhizobium sp.]|nr:MAG: DUF4915 domain-containing protein [Mesorhizobium sp.]
MTFINGFAVIGLSATGQDPNLRRPRARGAAGAKGAEPGCGLHVVDLRTGDATHWLRIEGVVEELYDVIALPGVRRPIALGFRTDEIRRVIRIASCKAQSVTRRLRTFE